MAAFFEGDLNTRILSASNNPREMLASVIENVVVLTVTVPLEGHRTYAVTVPVPGVDNLMTFVLNVRREYDPPASQGNVPPTALSDIQDTRAGGGVEFDADRTLVAEETSAQAEAVKAATIGTTQDPIPVVLLKKRAAPEHDPQHVHSYSPRRRLLLAEGKENQVATPVPTVERKSCEDSV